MAVKLFLAAILAATSLQAAPPQAFIDSWTQAVDVGCIQGDAAYYYNGTATQAEVNHALLTCILNTETGLGITGVPASQPSCPNTTWEWNTSGIGTGYQPQTFAEVWVYDWLVLYSDKGQSITVRWPSAGVVYTHPDGLDAYLVCSSLIADVYVEYCAAFPTDTYNCV